MSQPAEQHPSQPRLVRTQTWHCVRCGFTLAQPVIVVEVLHQCPKDLRIRPLRKV